MKIVYNYFHEDKNLQIIKFLIMKTSTNLNSYNNYSSNLKIGESLLIA